MNKGGFCWHSDGDHFTGILFDDALVFPKEAQALRIMLLLFKLSIIEIYKIYDDAFEVRVKKCRGKRGEL